MTHLVVAEVVKTFVVQGNETSNELKCLFCCKSLMSFKLRGTCDLQDAAHETKASIYKSHAPSNGR